MIINHGLIENPSFPPNNVKELIELAKSKPGEINYGTYGIGSSGHLNMVLFEAMTGMKIQAVHYKGAAPATNDVVAGHIQLCFVSAGSAVPLWKGGKLKLIAVGGSKRMPQLPDVPTVARRCRASRRCRGSAWSARPACRPTWWRRSTPRSARMFADPEFQKTFLDHYLFQSIAGSPDDLMNFIKSEEPKWRKVITDAKIKVE